MFKNEISKTCKKNNKIKIREKDELINNDIKELISNIALESACNNSEEDLEKDSEEDLEEDYIIDNNNNQLDSFLHRGVPPENIYFLNKNPASKGDIVDLKNHLSSKIIIFIYWKNGITHTDLDLTVVGFNKENKIYDECSYNKLKSFNNTVTHSGDITDAPNGASEFIKFSINDLKSKNKDLSKLLITVFSYNSIAFEDMKDSILGIGILPEDNNMGNGPEGSYVIDAVRLKGKSKLNISSV